MYAHPLVLRTGPVAALLQPSELWRSRAHALRQKILVPVDGTPAAEAALDHVIALARSMPLDVHLVNVQPPVMAGDINLFTTVGMVEAQRRTAGANALKHARSALSAAGIRHTAEVAFGSPAVYTEKIGPLW